MPVGTVELVSQPRTLVTRPHVSPPFVSSVRSDAPENSRSYHSRKNINYPMWNQSSFFGKTSNCLGSSVRRVPPAPALYRHPVGVLTTATTGSKDIHSLLTLVQGDCQTFLFQRP